MASIKTSDGTEISAVTPMMLRTQNNTGGEG